MMGFCYLPWLLAFGWLAIEQRLRWVWPAAAALALMWLDGSPYPPSFAALMLGLLALALAVLQRSIRPLWVTACVFALGLTVGAPSLMLSYLFAAAHPRPTALDSGSLHAVWSALLSRNQDLERQSGVMWGWQEVGGYVGVFLALGIAGLMRPWRALPWALVAAVLVTLTMGARGPWWPWALLHKLPVFSWEHLPYRFIIPLVQVIAVLAGFGADWIAAGCGIRDRSRACRGCHARLFLGGDVQLALSAAKSGRSRRSRRFPSGARAGYAGTRSSRATWCA